MVIDAGKICSSTTFSRGVKGRHVCYIVGEVLIADHYAEAIEPLAEELLILSPSRNAQAMNFSRLSVGGAISNVKVVAHRPSPGAAQTSPQSTGGAGNKLTSVNDGLLNRPRRFKSWVA